MTNLTVHIVYPDGPTKGLATARSEGAIQRVVSARSRGGTQRVVKHRGEAVVIVSAEEFDRKEELERQPESLLEFFQAAPGGDLLDLKRKRDSTRTVKW